MEEKLLSFSAAVQQDGLMVALVMNLGILTILSRKSTVSVARDIGMVVEHTIVPPGCVASRPGGG